MYEPQFQRHRPREVSTEYWTAFINISYVYFKPNSSVPMLHTEQTETGRFSTAPAYDVRGMAVEMVSERSEKEQSIIWNSILEDIGVPTPMSDELGKSRHPSENSHDEIDGTGCFPPFRENYPKDKPWIAVVKRGKCTFNEKVQNAMRLNASAILVYDDISGEALQSMKGKTDCAKFYFLYGSTSYTCCLYMYM